MEAAATPIPTLESPPERAPLTPMMKQWYDLKAQAGRALLFFRLGDFFELFEEDAVTAAPVMGVTLTARNNRGPSGGATSPLCGVPVSNLETYLHRVLDRGFKVALAEQTEEPGPGKSLVRREIVQWFTPGIRLLATEERPHYAGLVSGSADNWVLAAADVGTGHVLLETGRDVEALEEWIARLPLEDLRLASPGFESFASAVKYSEKARLLSAEESEKLCLSSLGLTQSADLPTENKLELQTLGSLFQILHDAHPRDRLRFRRPRLLPSHVWLTTATRRNLHFFEPSEKSLFHFLDKTQTALGRRELKSILMSPTRDLQEIKRRQELVAHFRAESTARKIFRSRLQSVLDLHRLLRKRRGPEQLLQISRSLSEGTRSAILLPATRHPDLARFVKLSDELEPLATELSRSLQASEETDLGWIQAGVSAPLDELRSLKQNADKLLLDLEEKTRNELGAPPLKVKFHQVFGYVFEVTSLHKAKIPESAQRIQTLANSERFKTAELESLEEKLLSLDGRLKEAERAELSRLFALVEASEALILEWSESLARLDCFQALAEVSEQHQWTRPESIDGTNASAEISLQSAVHPLSRGSFVPLSFTLSANATRVLLLTGPNMSGKSTLLRLAALVAVLHQIGSDVPAQQARLSLFDRINCRMGAQDDLTTGQSTFFVEMREVATMLQGATSRSLLIFDEIGRGTSTFDGMSLAWAITEAVHELGALSCVATHYLELSELEKTLPHLKSFHLGVEEIDGKLIFTRSLESGPASRSYGIHVARLAEMPSAILSRAEEKLHEFEKRRTKPRLVLEALNGA